MITERLDALAGDLGMEPARDSIGYFRLLLKLAERHVDGFDRTDARRLGNPGKGIDLDLILEFEKRTAGGKLSLTAAAPHVAAALGRTIGHEEKHKKAFAKAYRDQIKKLHPWEREAIDAMLRRELKMNSRRGK